MPLPEPTLALTLIERPTTAGSHLLLGVKKRGFGAGYLVAPGGHIEARETARLAAVRETHEEVGLALPSHTLTPAALLDFVFPHRPAWSCVVAAFRAPSPESEPRGSDELDPEWYPTQALPFARMWDDNRVWLTRALAGEQMLARIVFGPDNATVQHSEITALPTDYLD